MSTFPHDSFLGGLNLFIRENRSVILNKGERPPFPILISSPSFGQSLKNLNKADFGIVLAFFALGFPMCRWLVKGPFVSENFRRITFNSAWTTIIGLGMLTALNNSYYRLTGLVENGAEWSRKEPELKKYDFTKGYEEGTVWKYLRRRE